MPTDSLLCLPPPLGVCVCDGERGQRRAVEDPGVSCHVPYTCKKEQNTSKQYLIQTGTIWSTSAIIRVLQRACVFAGLAL